MIKILKDHKCGRKVMKRRKHAALLISAVFMAGLFFSLSGCGDARPVRYEATFLRLFDTRTTIIAYTNDKDEFARHSQLIYDSLEEYHKLYDIYNSYEGLNNLKTVNDYAGKAPVKVDRRIIDLLSYARQWHEKTGENKCCIWRSPEDMARLP